MPILETLKTFTFFQPQCKAKSSASSIATLSAAPGESPFRDFENSATRYCN